MSIIHIRSNLRPTIPLCGRADWESLTADTYTESNTPNTRNECWECRSITGEPDTGEWFSRFS